MSKTFTVITGSDDRPNWLEMRPGHFDTSKLPRKHRKPDPGALWTVADLLPETTAQTPAREPEDQAPLFDL